MNKNRSRQASGTPAFPRFRVGFGAAVLFAALLRTGAAADAGPLPPPPELLEVDYAGFPAEPAPTPPAEDLRQALAPLPEQPVAYAEPEPAPVPAAYSLDPFPEPASAVLTNTYHDFTISPPSRDMPSDYYDLPLPMDADAAIPGVLLPEFDDGFHDPGFRQTALAARSQGSQGLSVRQLEPFFALAKGSEGAALEARTKGDEHGYRDQLEKAVAAYMSVIGMADAGTEAREEAWYGIARCEYRRGNWWSAHDAIERSFPQQYEQAEVASRIKLQMFIGERLWRLGAEPAPNAVVDGKQLNGYQAASRVYAAAVFNQPTAKDAPLALLRQGDAHALEEDWKEAVKHYRQVVEYYPESDEAMQARSSLAESVLRQEWKGGLPEAGREDLSHIMDDVERSHERLSPEAEERRQRAVELANNQEAEARLRQAKSYLTAIRVKKSRDAGVFLLGEIVARFPTTDQAREAADILRGMGLEPPVALSDGRRFPMGAAWPEDTAGAAAGADAGFGGGSVRLGGQDDMHDVLSPVSLPPSPTRETVYEGIPGIVE